MSVLHVEKSVPLPCGKCGMSTTHRRREVLHEGHFLVMFFTMFLWTPVWIVMTLLGRMRPFRCATCGHAFAGKLPEIPPAAPAAPGKTGGMP